MSTETSIRATDLTRGSWEGGVLAGIAGGVPFCVALSLWFPRFLRESLPAMVALDGGIVGWVLQMSLAAAFGVPFALAIGALGWDDAVLPSVALGGVYGVVLWFGAFGLLFPVWMMLIGVPAVTQVAFNVVALAGYVAYGVVLGAVYPFVSGL